jgi:hypothetical protein
VAGLTQAQALDLFRYDPATGYLYWRKSNSNRSPVGSRAGTINKGYIGIVVNGKHYQAHRLIWFMHCGAWPEQIDHQDRVRHNNLLDNLRDVSNQGNARNLPVRKDNSSGVMGVCWSAAKSRWRAYIVISSRQIYLGKHVDWFEAVCARKAAEVRYGFHASHGR